MKIGILTYHRSQNYGAFMQAYALASAIRESTGDDVELIDYNSPAAERFYLREIFRDKTPETILYNFKKYRMFRKVVRQLPLSQETLITDDLGKVRTFLNGKYDAIIVGSDEIWKLDGMRGFPNAYWLPGVTGCRKLSYAASARNRMEEVNDAQREQMQSLLADFAFVGVRDGVTGELVDAALPEGRKATLVCDPTLAYTFSFDREEGKRLLREKFHVDPEKKVLGIMVNKKGLAKKIVQSYAGQVQIVSLFFGYPGTRYCPELTPFEWYQVIGALDGLITTFFHGMCFAINANTPFVILEQRNVAEPRFSKSYDLLARNGAEGCYIQANRDADAWEKLGLFVRDVLSGSAIADYSAIKRREQESFRYFLEALRNL